MFDLTTTCAYCLKKTTNDEVEHVFPVYDWKTEKLLGYYCKEHYMVVKAKNINRSHFGLEEYEINDMFA